MEVQGIEDRFHQINSEAQAQGEYSTTSAQKKRYSPMTLIFIPRYLNLTQENIIIIFKIWLKIKSGF